MSHQMSVQIAVAAGSVAVLYAYFQLPRTTKAALESPVIEVDCKGKTVTSGDIRTFCRQGKVVLLRNACGVLDTLPPTADSGIELFHPRRKLQAENLPNHISYGDLQAGLAQHNREHNEKSPLDRLNFHRDSDTEIASRNALYRQRPLYGMVNVAEVDPASQTRLAWCLPKELLSCWKRTVSYFWVGPSPGSLHYDEFDNILFQLRGRKTVCLVPNRNATTRWGLPGWWANLPNHSIWNNQFLSSDTLKTHDYLDPAECVTVELVPGDGLVIPAGVLHGPSGSTTSLSINTFLLNGPAPCGTEAWGMCQWLVSRVDLGYLVWRLGGWKLGYVSPHHSVRTLKL
eukprot:m.286540 g.286540  ORF g.286540 m.286540 type:complete len:343 (+) comp27060_c0_seq1:3763-4791(+)